MHELFGLVCLAALIVLLMRMPKKFLLLILAVFGGLWLFMPGFFRGSVGFLPIPSLRAVHFGHWHWAVAPHIWHWVLAVAFAAALIWLLVKVFAADDDTKKTQ